MLSISDASRGVLPVLFLAIGCVCFLLFYFSTGMWKVENPLFILFVDAFKSFINMFDIIFSQVIKFEKKAGTG